MVHRNHWLVHRGQGIGWFNNIHSVQVEINPSPSINSWQQPFCFQMLITCRPGTIIQIFELFEYLSADRHSNIAFYSIRILVNNE